MGPVGPINTAARFALTEYNTVLDQPNDPTGNSVFLDGTQLKFYGSTTCTDTAVYEFLIDGATRVVETINLYGNNAASCGPLVDGQTMWLVHRGTAILQLNTNPAGNLNCGPTRELNNEGIILTAVNGDWYCMESEPSV